MDRQEPLHPVLRAKMMESGLSAQEFSDMTGLLPHVVKKWISGRAKVPCNHAAKKILMRYFGLTERNLARAKKNRAAPAEPVKSSNQPNILRQSGAIDDDEKPRMARCLSACPRDCSWRYAFNGADRCRLFQKVPYGKPCIFYLTDHITLPAVR